ncbi:PREDICTED: HIV Tat-specific factor 1-like [Amphimedon queenslandica]|uniref:17S U2 SnRNP complex component HTATSF1 n=1 Tax=Amphimedon queenslandica TaxID=400682 RepID=A0A1X7VHW9_AMPQE|nr:PREDICTED: HIV Tat-specific factor 1-like [Amphimedon queenslandica]|eukprot:XP_019848654.1 PREDICTED: HIV Tat-specific factor 1-like [Amphimedon queenslandica]
MEEDFKYQLEAQKVEASKKEDGGLATYTDPTDGTVYEWDPEKRAWFPKIDNTFLANYHASYGFYQPEEEKETEKKVEETASASKTETVEERGGGKTDGTSEPEPKKKKVNEPSWFDIDESHNTNVYVSGLPLDITLEEFAEHMTKCGIIMEDDDGDPKVKLYHDSDGQLKGDGLCCYLKIESVQLALDLLDESEIRGKKLSVKRAQFQMKGEYNPSLRKKKQNKKKAKGSKQERLLDWKERKGDGKPKFKHQRIVIFKHLFDPKEFEVDPTLITDIRDDLREECSKFGEVKKVLVFDRHVDGVASVAFKEFEPAEAAITAMNGRYYAGRQLEVFLWDGVTNYQIEETDKERELRLKQWEEYLQSGASKSKNDNGNTVSSETTGTTATEQSSFDNNNT